MRRLDHGVVSTGANEQTGSQSTKDAPTKGPFVPHGQNKTTQFLLLGSTWLSHTHLLLLPPISVIRFWLFVASTCSPSMPNDQNMAALSSHGHDSHDSHDGRESTTSRLQSGGSHNHHQTSAERYETHVGRIGDDAVARTSELLPAQQIMLSSPTLSTLSGPPEDDRVDQRTHANANSSSSSASNHEFASDSTTPQFALESLFDSINAAAEHLESRAQDNRSVSPSLLARYLRQWETTIADVSQTLAQAEHERIEAIQAQLAFDCAVSENYRRYVDRLVNTWQEKLRVMELECERTLEHKTDSFSAKLADQKERYTMEIGKLRNMYEMDIAHQTVKVAPFDESGGGSQTTGASSSASIMTQHLEHDSTAFQIERLDVIGEEDAHLFATNTAIHVKDIGSRDQGTALLDSPGDKVNISNFKIEPSKSTPAHQTHIDRYLHVAEHSTALGGESNSRAAQAPGLNE